MDILVRKSSCGFTDAPATAAAPGCRPGPITAQSPLSLRTPAAAAHGDDVLLATIAAEGSDRIEFAKLPALERRGFTLLKYALRAIAMLSPRLAAHLSLRVLSMPPKARPRSAHHKLVTSAERFELNAAGAKARGYAWGSGPAVIFCHGWCADASWFAPYIEALNQRGFQVVAFDAPGHGLAAPARTDMFDFAACIGGAADWVQARGGRIQAVVGHSVGGVAAALAMRDWNIPCDRLALISAFSDCNWVADAFIKMTGLSRDIGERMRDQYVGLGRGPLALRRTSVVDMIRHAPAHVFLAHDKDDADVPFWHSLVLLEGCGRAHFYRTAGRGHRRVLRDAGLVNALVKFVSN